MKNKIIVFVLLLLSTAACKFVQKHNSAAPSLTTDVNYPMLDSTNVFDSTKVAQFKPSADAREYARKIYLNAIDLYSNQHKADESVPLFFKSARIAPSANTYLKLGEAAYAIGDIELSQSAFHMAIYDPDVLPFAEMGMARTTAQRDPYWSMEMLEHALRDYPFDVKEVEKDTAFAGLKDKEEFKLMLSRYNQSDENRKKVVLRMFAANFVKLTPPYSIPEDSLMVSTGKDIDYLYADIIKDLVDGSRAFSRMVDKTYQYVNEVSISPAYHTFIYRAVNYSYDDSIAPNYYYAATVDTNGISIDQQMIACYCSPVSLQTASIDTSGLIEVKAISQSYKYSPVDSGYEHNEVLKQELKGTTYFQFMPNGKIERLDKRPDNDPVRADAGR